MNKSNRVLFITALALIGVTALGMGQLKAHQKLGAPGVKTKPIPGSQRLELFLPQYVLDCDSTIIPTDKEVLRGLPQDTSFIQRRYLATNQYPLWFNIVLMGTDRTSIHKPQFCLKGSGWDMDDANSSFDTVHVESPRPYDLPVMKLMNSRDITQDGRQFKIKGIYVYWFVADHDLTADHWTRMRKMATHLLSTGELERWAYVSCLGICLPGQEDATYARMKKFIAAAVPQFQLSDGSLAENREPGRTASR